MTLFSNSFLFKSALCGSCALALCVSMASGAQAQSFRKAEPAYDVPSWYFSVTGSLNFVDDTALSYDAAGSVGRGNISTDGGVGFGGAVGYRPRHTNSAWDHTRFEVEAGVAESDIDTTTVTSGSLPSLSSSIEADRVMANMYVDVQTSLPFRPYVGAGVGIARLQLANDDDTVLAYQAMTGITYTPASFPIVEFGLGYRYLNAADAEINLSSGNQLSFDYETHSAEATFRAYF